MGGVSPARYALVGLIVHIVLNMFIRHSGRRQIQIQIQNKKSTIGLPPKKPTVPDRRLKRRNKKFEQSSQDARKPIAFPVQ